MRRAIQVYDGDGTRAGKRFDWEPFVLKDFLFPYQTRVVTTGNGFIELGVLHYGFYTEDAALKSVGNITEMEGIAVSVKLQSLHDQRIEGPYVGVIGAVKFQVMTEKQDSHFTDLFLRLLT